jgi:hypothetical protein
MPPEWLPHMTCHGLVIPHLGVWLAAGATVLLFWMLYSVEADR